VTDQLVLCADDFGQSAAINEAVLELVSKGRLTAVSVMVTGPALRGAARALAREASAEIGLHVTLSGGWASRPVAGFAPDGRLPHIDRLTAAAFAGRLPVKAIAAEIEWQFDIFETVFGHAPAFVDAHQHSHMLPGIRSRFLDAAARRAPRAWVRTCEERFDAIRCRAGRWLALRSSILSRGMRAAAARRELACNDSFSGIYDFGSGADYGALFPRFLKAGRGNHLVICHPARRGDPGDRIGPARVREHEFLSTTSLDMLAAAAGMRLSKFVRH